MFNRVGKRIQFETSSPFGIVSRAFDRGPVKKETCSVCLSDVRQSKILKVAKCGHIVCYFCWKNIIVTGIKSEDGVSLLCPFAEEDCGDFSIEDIKILHGIETTTKINSLETELQNAFLRSGVKEFDYIFNCPGVDCGNLLYDTQRLNTERFHYFEPTPKEVVVEPTTSNRKIYYVYKTVVTNMCIFSCTKRVSSARFVSEDIVSVHEEEEEEDGVWSYRKDEQGNDYRKFKCEKCEYTFCVLCHQIWEFGIISHDDISCEEYYQSALLDNEDREVALTNQVVEQKIANNTLRRCPNCTVLIEKNYGCAHMRCTSCKYEFCWTCGGPHQFCACRGYT